jgi:hypothetical protein
MVKPKKSKKYNTTPWSFSSMKLLFQCPKKFFHVRVMQEYKEHENEAMLYGSAFHEAAELYVADTSYILPKKFKFAKGTLDAIKFKEKEGYVVIPEYKMGITKGLAPCTFDSEEAFARGVGDIILMKDDKGLCGDYKTGASVKYADMDQLELMAIMMFVHFPEIEEVKTSLLFVVINKIISETYYRKDLKTMWNKWKRKHEILEKFIASGTWNPIQSGLCKKHCCVLECPHNGLNR